MKLLAVSTSCFSATNREFYRRLNSNNLLVMIAIPSTWDFGKGEITADAKQENDPEIAFLESTNFHHRLFKLRGLNKQIDQFKPNIIYYEGDPGSVMAAILGNISKKKGIKFIALSCENLSQNPLAVVKREGKKQFFNACIKYSLIQYSKRKLDTLFVINEEGLSYFKKLGFKQVIKTPLGFNERTFRIDNSLRNKIRKDLKISDSTVVIAYFGRLVYEKGVHLLIEALNNLQTKNWVFLIDEFSRYKTDYQKEVESLINQSNFKDKTIFFEADHTEIAAYMNASDITVLPSVPTKKWVEQYGRVVPESLACGNLLIISDQGAQKEFFEGGYKNTFTPPDTSKLRDLIDENINLIRSNRYLKKENANKATKKFSLEAQLSVFKSVLGV